MKPFLTIRLSVLILFLLLVCNPAIGQAQSQTDNGRIPKNKLKIFWGFHFVKNQDLIFSPMIYSGGGLNVFGLDYERKVERGIYRLSGGYDNIKVSSSTPNVRFQLFEESISRLESRSTQFHVNFGHARQFFSSDRFTLYGGGLLEAKINLLDYNFGLSDDRDYLFVNSIHPWLFGEFDFSQKKSLKIEMDFALLAYVARPDYSIVDNEEIQYEGSEVAFLYEKGKWTSVNEFRAIRFSLEYNWAVSRSVDWSFRYGLGYLKKIEPLPISLLRNSFETGLSLNF